MLTSPTSNTARKRAALAALFSLLLLGCYEGGSETVYETEVERSAGFAWGIPDYIPLPNTPAGNEPTEAMFQLGRHLFYERRLSGNGTLSCSSCHQQNMAFAEPLERSVGSTGEVHPRNSQSLVNVAFTPTLTWANPSLRTIEQQIAIPLFSEFPVEHGINEDNKAAVLASIANDPTYQQLFSEALAGMGSGSIAEDVNFSNIIKALATFVRGINSFNSDSDRFEGGDTMVLSEDAQRGRQLFFSEALECFHCHGGYNFTDSTTDRSQLFVDTPFHNTGLYNIDGMGAYPEESQGIIEITGKASDMGRFRAPTLRNVGVTAPYMHDGSIATLEEVIRTYAAGGRNITSGPNSGDGRENPFLDGFVSGFEISDDDVQALVAFMHSLTDTELLVNPRFSNPWQN